MIEPIAGMHDFTAHCLDKIPNARMSPAELLSAPS